jgi:ribosomal protein S21
MPITIRKKDKETQGAFLRRFTKKIQQSGVLMNARKSRFHSRSLNKRAVRNNALRKVARKDEIETLKKLGKFEEKFGRNKWRK